MLTDINRLKVVLAEKKRTNKWLCEQLGVNPSTVSKWCTSSSQPDLQTLVKIAKLLDMWRENGNKEAQFDVSKLTAFCVDVYSNEVDESTTQKTTQKIPPTLSAVQIAIIEYIHSHPHASRKEIAANINGITENGVKYHMQKLQKQGVIKRIGADKVDIGRCLASTKSKIIEKRALNC